MSHPHCGPPNIRQRKGFSMKAFVTSVAAVAIGLTVIGTSQAAGRSAPASRGGHQGYANYHLSHGKKFEHGYFYEGKYHQHWSYSYLDKRYGTYLYYDPCCYSFYYYCAPKACYYPVSYCPYQTYCWNEPAYFTPSAPPATPAPEPLVKVTVTNTANAVNNSSGVVAPVPVAPAVPVVPAAPGRPAPMPRADS